MASRYAGVIFIGICLILATIGCLSVYSASHIYAFAQGHAPAFYLYKQVLGILIAICIALCIWILPQHLVYKLPPYAFGITLIACIATLLPGIGRTMHGASRWITCMGIPFQPSELLKICTIWYLAYLLQKKTFTMYDFTHTFIPIMCIITAATAALMIQPDFGQATILGATCLLLLYTFEVPRSYLASACITGSAVLAMLILHAPYRMYRIAGFINPWQDPHGSGFQVIQSLIAIGNGGLWGRGIAQSQQKYFYLPMHHTDFIFAIFAEETGCIGALTLLLLYAGMLIAGHVCAMQSRTRLHQCFILGYTWLISIQAATNISIALGLLPTKGLGLPFISYGVSALIAHGIGCGIFLKYVCNDKERKRVCTVSYTSGPSSS